MALVFDATVGGANANSNATIEQANAYHLANLNREVWTNAGDFAKQAALTMATRMLDQLIEWNAWKATTTQRLRNPRTGLVNADGETILSTVMAEGIVNGTAELGFWFLVSNRIADNETQGIEQMKLGPMDMTFTDGLKTQIIPVVVLDMIRPFGRLIGSSPEVKLSR